MSTRQFSMVCIQSLALALSMALVMATAAHAAPDSAVVRLQKYFANVRSLKATFTQTVTKSTLSGPAESTGTVLIKRPNHFRWNYETPHKQIIDADGKQLWIYDVALEQVTVRPMSRSLDSSPAMLLSGQGSLTDAFRIADSQVKNGAATITLIPKSHDAAFKKVRISIGSDRLQWMELTSASLGQVTRITFSHVVTNAAIDDAVFKFTPPPGADVIDASR